MSPTLRATLRLLVLPCLLGLLAGRALATWSIVVIHRGTGEVGVGTASCITGSIRGVVPMIVVGRGAAATQATPGGLARARIWTDLQAGVAPQAILDALAATDPFHHTRQYGIASVDGPPATFTGTHVGQGVCGVTGSAGDLEYAIQGNVMVGEEVCLAAEQALLRTPGDLSQRLMAAMDAARRMGGDGRCSCSPADPTACGAPPAAFTKSAHAGAVLIARPGDVDDDACPAGGCAGGSYYLELENSGGAADPDPVLVMLGQYAQWRASRAGVVDHVRTVVEPSDQRLVADGFTTLTVTVRLRDIEGQPVAAAGQTLRVVQTLGEPVAAVGAATPMGVDALAFDLTATTTPGRAQYTLVVDDGSASIQLHPPLVVDSAPVRELVARRWDLSASAGETARLVVNLPFGSYYNLLGTLSGTSPGTPYAPGLVVPLNDDRFFRITQNAALLPGLQGFHGFVDGNGRGEASLVLGPGALSSVVGARMQFCAVVANGVTPAAVTNVAGFAIVP